MTKLDLLAEANPVATDDEWGTTEQGRTLFASIEEVTETASMLPAARPRVSRPWIYVTVGFAVTIAAALPLLLSGGTEPEGVPPDGTGFISAETPDGILDDNYVTRTEFEMAADATIQCVLDGGGEASWDYGTVTVTPSDGLFTGLILNCSPNAKNCIFELCSACGHDRTSLHPLKASTSTQVLSVAQKHAPAIRMENSPRTNSAL